MKFFVNGILIYKCDYIYWKIYIMNNKIVVKNIFLSPSFFVFARTLSFFVDSFYFSFFFFLHFNEDPFILELDRSKLLSNESFHYLNNRRAI